jgi:hypothetical protein
LAWNSSSAGIPSAHCWASPLSYHLDKIRYSKEGFLRCFEEGSSKKRNSFFKEMEVKITSYNIIKWPHVIRK